MFLNLRAMSLNPGATSFDTYKMNSGIVVAPNPDLQDTFDETIEAPYPLRPRRSPPQGFGNPNPNWNGTGKGMGKGKKSGHGPTPSVIVFRQVETWDDHDEDDDLIGKIVPRPKRDPDSGTLGPGFGNLGDVAELGDVGEDPGTEAREWKGGSPTQGSLKHKNAYDDLQ